MIISGYYGPQVWMRPMSTFVDLPSPLDSFSTWSFRDFWVYIILVSFAVAHLPSCIINVAKARRAKNLPLAPVFLDWTPMVIYTASTFAWMSSPWSILLRENHLVLFCVTQSFVFGRMTTKIILAHLTRQPFPYWTVLMAPLVGGAVLVNLPRLGYAPVDGKLELYYLWAYFAYAVAVYFHWAALVISAICNYLGINCLTIPTEKQEALKAANGKAH